MFFEFGFLPSARDQLRRQRGILAHVVQARHAAAAIEVAADPDVVDSRHRHRVFEVPHEIVERRRRVGVLRAGTLVLEV